jgi:REP-associated tyrosine transposase
MSNVSRLCTSDRIFFITTNLNRGERLFDVPEYQIILGTIVSSRQRLGCLLCGYVLMPDHWHALIATQHPLTISSVLQDIKRISSLKINRLRKTKGSRWQHQFWDRFVRHPKEFTERLEYMHYNPVRRGLAIYPEQWRWSSVNNFSLDKTVVATCPIQIDYVQLPDSYRA